MAIMQLAVVTPSPGAAGAAGAAASFLPVARHAHDAASVEVALRELAKHARLPSNREWIVGNGGSQLVVAALQAHVASAAVAELGCNVLADLSLYHVGSSAIVLASGLRSILNAIWAHRSEPRVVAAVCHALHFLCHPAWSGYSAMSSSVTCAKELLAALTAHPAHAGIALSACTALQKLAAEAAQRAAMIDAGGVAILRAALAAHAASAETVAAATATLRLLDTGSSATAVTPSAAHTHQPVRANTEQQHAALQRR